MAKIISQETFDDVLKENIVDFSMSANEAREETIKQFQAQGINLANIIQDLSINEETGRPILTESIDRIKAHISGEKKIDNAELSSSLKVLETECQKSIPHRVLAYKSGAHEIIVTILEQEFSSDQKPNKDIALICIKAAIALTNKQPDVFDAEALAVILKILNTEHDHELISSVLQWLSKACIMHETNRQDIVNAEIITYLKPLVGSKNPQILKDACAVFRHLILDDDIRVEFGKAHEHARTIANEVLVDLTKLIPEFDDVNVVADIVLTIASLTVRQELCAAVEEADGIQYVFDVMRKNTDAARLNKESIKLIRALAGNDTTKVHIVQLGAAPIIYNVLNNFKTNEQVSAVALACISTLTLRVKENSAEFFKTGIAEVIADAMRLHPKSKIVQRNSAWAIRNMVSRSRDQCETFLSYGVEEMLNAAMVEHPSLHHDVKAALRDLGCKVDLKEEWTGTAEKKITQ